jgi:hypothetical protein
MSGHGLDNRTGKIENTMRTKSAFHRRLRDILTMIFVIFACAFAGSSLAQDIHPTHKYAWSENTGWLNFSPAQSNLKVYPSHLEGYVWGENIGWIRLGTYTGGGAHTYQNTTVSNYGVNRSGNQLSGYAWGENVGWINFGQSAHHTGVRINSITGSFSGYAWGENIGWIKFSGTAQDGTPYRVAEFRTGSLRVFIEPSEAVDAGAQWRIKGTSTWYYSGETLRNISIGTYTIEFKVVPGWRPDGTVIVTVEEDKTLTGTGYYFEKAALLPGVLMLLLDDEEPDPLKPPIGIGIP